MKNVLLAVALSGFVGGLSGQATGAERITGIYSNMTFNKESGDVSGIEVFIVFAREGFKAVFQDAEGSPSVPVIVSAYVKGSTVSFELPERNGYSGKFMGRVVNGKLVGRFLTGAIGKEGKPEIKLRRGKSYWQ